MKLNGTPHHYMPVPQNQSDDDETLSIKDSESRMKLNTSITDKTNFSENDVKKLSDITYSKDIPFSHLQKIFFVLSLLLCVLFVVTFAWLLPCKLPSDVEELGHLREEWTLILHNVSLSSSVCLAKGNNLRSPLLIFGYENEGNETSGIAGLIALQEYDGKQLWQLSLHTIPSYCWCSNNGTNDDISECIFIGNDGVMMAVDVTKGTILWYLHNHSGYPAPQSLSYPVIISGCDGDKIPDLAVVYATNDADYRINLAVISGSKGCVIGSLINLKLCTTMPPSLTAWKSYNFTTDLVFFCSGEILAVSEENLCQAVSSNNFTDLGVKKVYSIAESETTVKMHVVPNAEDLEDLVIVWDSIYVATIQKNANGRYTERMKVFLAGHSYLRTTAVGMFTDNVNMQVVVVSGDFQTASVVTGLNLADGKVAWTLKENSTVTSIINLPNVFGERDGLLLRTLSPHYHSLGTLQDEQSLYKARNIDTAINATDTILKSDLVQNKTTLNLEVFEEKYILVNCGKTASLKTLTSQQITSLCYSRHLEIDMKCQPAIYLDKNTVIASVMVNEKIVELMVVGTSLVPFTSTENEGLQVQMFVKHFHLSGFMAPPRCAN